MQKMNRMTLFLSAIFMVAAAAATVSAAPPDFTYQGRLLQPDEAPVPDGPYPARFSLWTDPTVGMGTEVWSENQDIVTTGGLFSTYLGQVSSFFDVFADFAASPLYLQVEVMIGGATRTLEPRVRIASAPYALDADGVHSEASSGLARARGIIASKPGSGTPFSQMYLDADSDGDGVAEGYLDLGTTDDQSELTVARKRPGRVKYSNITMRATADSVIDVRDCDSDDDGLIDSRMVSTIGGGGGGGGGAGGFFLIETDSDGDGVPETSDSAVVTGDTARRRLSSSGIGSSGEDGVEITAQSAGRRLAVHNLGSSGEDGVEVTSVVSLDSAVEVTNITAGGVARRVHAIHAGPEHTQHRMSFFDVFNEMTIDQDCDATGALSKWKGGMSGSTTGTIRMQATPDSAVSVLDTDSDGDGIPESEVSQRLTPTTSSLAINTKGTSAKREIKVSTGLDSASILVGADLDNDGGAENEVSQHVTPTTSSVAIKTKGTGADKDRVVSVSSGTDDSTGVVACDVDDDGDGISEYGVILTVTDEDGDVGSDMRCVADTDDDGVPESDASLRVTPTTSSVAIKTKGTGADKNRSISSTCDSTSAIHLLATDDDGDGVVDRQISSTVDTASTEIAIDEPGAQVAMGMKKGWDGTIKGRFTVENASTRMIELNSDGDGYFGAKVGIGVDVPTHRIDVAGGAYCDGTNWVNASDVNSKENFAAVDGAELLAKIDQLQITRWNYKQDDESVTHIGPTAQDFHSAFGVGSNDKSISTVDPSGIALAAIQELVRQLRERDLEIEEMKAELVRLRDEIRSGSVGH